MCDVIIHVEISNWTSPQHSKRYMAIVHPSWSWSVLMKECRIYYTPIFLLFAFLIIIIIYRWKLPWLTNALNKIMIPMVDGGFGTFILYWRQTGGRRSQFFFFFWSLRWTNGPAWKIDMALYLYINCVLLRTAVCV